MCKLNISWKLSSIDSFIILVKKEARVFKDSMHSHVYVAFSVLNAYLLCFAKEY